MFTKLLKKLLLALQIFFVSLYIIFEELIWDRFAEPIYKFIKSLALFEKLETLLNKTNKYIVLIIFILSFVIGEVIGVVSPLIALKGYVVLGVIFYGLKLVVVAFAFWLFNTQKEKLLRFWIIRVSYKRIIQFTQYIKNSYVFKLIKERAIIIKSYLKKIYKQFKHKVVDFFNKSN